MAQFFRWSRITLYALAGLWAVLVLGFGKFQEQPGPTVVGALLPSVIVYAIVWAITSITRMSKRLVSGFRSGPTPRRTAAAAGTGRSRSRFDLAKARTEVNSGVGADGQADDTQAVDELLQVSTSDSGETVIVRVRPVTAALMSFVKGALGLPDTIDISSDEQHGTWREGFSVETGDAAADQDARPLSVQIDTFENESRLECRILVDELGPSDIDRGDLEKLVAAANKGISTGVFRITHCAGNRGAKTASKSHGWHILYAAEIDFRNDGPKTVGAAAVPDAGRIEALFETGMKASKALRDELSKLKKGRAEGSSSRPEPILSKEEFKAAVAAAKDIARAHKASSLTPALLMAGFVRAARVPGPAQAAIKAVVEANDLARAGRLLQTISIDPSQAAQTDPTSKMPLSPALQALLKEHSRADLAEFFAALLGVDHARQR